MVQTKRGITLHRRFFSDKANGGKDKALRKAQEHRDALLEALPARPHSYAKNKASQTGVVGVSEFLIKFPSGQQLPYYYAQWVDAKGRTRGKKVSITRYGRREALAIASQARINGIALAVAELK